MKLKTYSLRIRKRVRRFRRNLSGLTEGWSKLKTTVLFALIKLIVRLPFLQRYIILAMYVPLSMAEGKRLPQLVIFGLGPEERKSFAATEAGQQSAVAYPSSPAITQCLFLALVRPSLIIVPAGKMKQIPPMTRNFLRSEKISVLAMGDSTFFDCAINSFDVNRTVKFFPALFYTDTSRTTSGSTTLILHYSLEFMGDIAKNIKADTIIMFPSDERNASCLRSLLHEVKVDLCLAPELNTVPENMLSSLKEAEVKISSLSQKTVRQLLLTPQTKKPPFPKARRAVLLNIKDGDILANSLVNYHIFSLKNDAIDTAINLLRGYTLIWVGNNVPKRIREAASQNSLPILLFYESALSSFGWRKSYPAPLWLIQAQGGRNADTEKDIQLTSFVQENNDRLNSPQELETAKNFIQELHLLQDTVHRTSQEFSGRKVKSFGKDTIIALWQSCRGGLSLEEFLQAVAERENKGKILVLALNGSYSVTGKLALSASLRRRCIMLKHLSDLDDYLSSASCVHVHAVNQGIEAFLRGKRTVAHVPAWYTGWGLTEDLFTQNRPAALTKEQFVLAVFLSFSYKAPYSWEPVSPLAALAFWYTRQRPDLGRFYETIQKAFRPDSRFGILDLRVSLYNEREIDSYIEERLRTSVFGHIIADMLSFSMQMPKLPVFLSLFSARKSIELLFSLILQAYYQLNYEQLNYILHRSSEWFSNTKELSDAEIVKYYQTYHDAVIRNWFHDSRPPVFRLPVNAAQKQKALLSYAKILIMCFAYDELGALATGEAAACTPDWYADLLFSLYNNRRSEIKETDINKHVEMRLVFFDLYKKARIAQGLNDFSETFTRFMHESFKENRSGMRELASKIAASPEHETLGKDEQDMILLVVDMLRENLEQELSAQLAKTLLPDELVKRLMDREQLIARKESLHGQSGKKWRVNTLKKNLKTHIKRNESTERFASKLARANDISICRYYLDCAGIINKAPTIRHPKGIIFFGHYGTFFSAILPVVLYALRKRGYAVWPMYSNHIPLNVPVFHPLAKFAYALPHNSGPIQLEWTIDYEHKRIEAVGVNFYECFFEAITILVRRYEFDWESPDIQRQFRRLLKKTDSTVAWVHNLCCKLRGMSKPPKVAVMSIFAYNLPESALRVYLSQKGQGLVHFIYYRHASNYDLVHSRSDISTRIAGLDMTLWPDCRLSFLPARRRFNPWYEQRKNSPQFLAELEQIRKDLLAGVIEQHNDMLDYLREQKAQGKRIICCIGRLLFDQAEHKPGGPAHADIRDWLCHTVEIAASNPNIIVLIRPHPHESNPVAAVRSRQTLRDVLPRELPPNVLYVDPLEMTVQSLIGIMDLAVIWLGTAAWELSALGIPCAVMSNSGYDQVPFNAIFPQSREEYVRLLTTEAMPKLDEDTRLRGAACLHYVKNANMTRPYPYAFVRANNAFRTVPWFRKELIKKYMAEGDENIDFVVDQITEGIPIN